MQCRSLKKYKILLFSPFFVTYDTIYFSVVLNYFSFCLRGRKNAKNPALRVRLHVEFRWLFTPRKQILGLLVLNGKRIPIPSIWVDFGVRVAHVALCWSAGGKKEWCPYFITVISNVTALMNEKSWTLFHWFKVCKIRNIPDNLPLVDCLVFGHAAMFLLKPNGRYMHQPL
jgi:hypothetical protein